jgi:hypothetical protein
VEFRLDDKKIQQDCWDRSTDLSGVFMDDVRLNNLLYGHLMPHKEATTPQVRRIAIVRSFGFLTAIQRATDLGINPGGEVMCTPIPRKDLCRVPADLRNRLLSETEVRDRLEGRQMCEEPGTVTVYVSRGKG